MSTTPGLTYATPSESADGSPVAAGVWVMIGGLVLVFFGGCFCIGVLLTLSDALGPGSSRWERDLLTFVLYACAAACFVAGAYVTFLGLKKLLGVGR